MSEQAKKIGESAGATLARFGFKPKPAAEPSEKEEGGSRKRKHGPFDFETFYFFN